MKLVTEKEKEEREREEKNVHENIEEEKAVERERKEKEREREYQREERAVEHEREEHEREYQRGEREHHLQVLQLQNQGHATQTPNRLQVAKFLPLLPQFSDYDPDVFFREFESSRAEHGGQAPKLNGKSLCVLNRVQDNTDYEVVKNVTLIAYTVTTERYRRN